MVTSLGRKLPYARRFCVPELFSSFFWSPLKRNWTCCNSFCLSQAELKHAGNRQWIIHNSQYPCSLLPKMDDGMSGVAAKAVNVRVQSCTLETIDDAFFSSAFLWSELYNFWLADSCMTAGQKTNLKNIRKNPFFAWTQTELKRVWYSAAALCFFPSFVPRQLHGTRTEPCKTHCVEGNAMKTFDVREGFTVHCLYGKPEQMSLDFDQCFWAQPQTPFTRWKKQAEASKASPASLQVFELSRTKAHQILQVHFVGVLFLRSKDASKKAFLGKKEQNNGVVHICCVHPQFLSLFETVDQGLEALSITRVRPRRRQNYSDHPSVMLRALGCNAQLYGAWIILCCAAFSKPLIGTIETVPARLPDDSGLINKPVLPLAAFIQITEKPTFANRSRCSPPEFYLKCRWKLLEHFYAQWIWSLPFSSVCRFLPMELHWRKRVRGQINRQSSQMIYT